VPEPIFGVVDLGSNSVHLLVARCDGRTIAPLVDLSEGVRLGEAVDDGGAIGAPKLAALLATLGSYQAIAAEAGVPQLHLLATHAIRVATDQAAVCAAIAAQTGRPVTVLSTDQEAALAFLGVMAGAPAGAPQVVVDIGGGSMQVVLGVGETVWASRSWPLGAARVARSFLPDDPPTPADEQRLIAHLAAVLVPTLPPSPAPLAGAIGAGGTLRRLPELLGLAPGVPLPPDALDAALVQLRGQPAGAIAARTAIKPERARLLLPGVLLLHEVVRGYASPPLQVSIQGVREGAILALARGVAIESGATP